MAVTLVSAPQRVARQGGIKSVVGEFVDESRLVGPGGPVMLKPQGRLVTNSSEVIREAVIAGLGIALRSTWDIGEELKSGQILQVLPGYESGRGVSLSAVYPSREFLPAKVRLFIDYLAALYGPTPYWDQ